MFYDQSGGVWNQGGLSIGNAGTTYSAPAATLDQSTDLNQVFAEGPGNSLNMFYDQSGGVWNQGGLSIGNAGTTYSAPAATLDQSTDLNQVFAEGPGNSLNMFYDQSGGVWNQGGLSIGNAGTTYSAPAATLDQSTDLNQVFAEGPGNSLNMFYDQSGGVWNQGGLSIGNAGTTYSAPAATLDQSTDLNMVLAQDSDNVPEQFYDESGGVWQGPDTVTGPLPSSQAPSITSSSATTFVSGTGNYFEVTASGSPMPDFAESGPLPNGVSFNDNGDGTATLSGVPPAGTSGSYPITITANNSVSPEAVQSFVLTVVQVAITSSSVPLGAVGTKYSAALTASGGNPPYKWSLAKGSTPLPPGLKLKATGVISGKAKTAGTYPFSVQVVDTKTKTKPKTQNSATASLSIMIS